MKDAESDITQKTYLGFRLAVGLVGLAIIALFVMLGSVAMKQSATAEALEKSESLHEDAQSAPRPGIRHVRPRTVRLPPGVRHLAYWLALSGLAVARAVWRERAAYLDEEYVEAMTWASS